MYHSIVYGLDYIFNYDNTILWLMSLEFNRQKNSDDFFVAVSFQSLNFNVRLSCIVNGYIIQ